MIRLLLKGERRVEDSSPQQHLFLTVVVVPEATEALSFPYVVCNMAGDESYKLVWAIL